MVFIDILRRASLMVGIIIILMWLAGCLGQADFTLIFVVQ